MLTINTATNTVTSTQSLGGPGANFALYDKSRNRLYVANPGAHGFQPAGRCTFLMRRQIHRCRWKFDRVVNIPAPPPCAAAGVQCNPVTPVSVAALPDGSRFYVASYVTATLATGSCVSGCVIPQLTVFDARSMTVKPISASTSLLPPSISLLGQPLFGATQYAVARVSSCDPAPTLAPPRRPFRMFAAAAPDSSHVYVSICDAGSIADVIATTSTLSTGGVNTPDQLVTDLAAPFSAASAPTGGQPALQNPIFLLSGQ